MTLGVCGSGASLVGAFQARDQVAGEQASADEMEIIQLRSQLRRVHLDETNVVMLQLFDAASQADVDAARDARESVRATATERLRELAGSDGPVATEALFLYDLLRNDGLAGEREADPGILFDTGRAAARDSRPPDEQLDDQALALYDLMRTDVAGSQVLNDAMDAAYTSEAPEVPEYMAEYVSRSEPYIRSDGGYLGPDPASPLLDSYVYDATAEQAHPAVERVSERIAQSGLWEYDQWIRSWQEGTPGPAPMTIEELVEEVHEVERDLRPIVDDALDDARQSHVHAANSSRTRSTLLFVVAAVLGSVALAVAGSMLRRHWRAVHRAAERISTDPLTGAGNRHALEDHVGPTTRNAAYGWHLVAAVDMDRFKMINDTWGHAVGDRVLVEMTRRLSAVVEHWRGSTAGATGSVIRMGGDEFVLTLHAKAPLDEEAIRAQIDGIRAASISVGDQPGDTVTLSFSVGVTTASGVCEVDDLVRIADLAAYEEKAQRAKSQPDRRRRSPSHDAVALDAPTADRTS